MYKALSAVLLTLSAVACSSGGSDAAQGGVVFANTLCPMMGGDVEADGDVVQFQGHSIGFCCGGCAPKFEKLSDAEKLAKLADCGYTPGG
jgi:hypothetical protein